MFGEVSPWIVCQICLVKTIGDNSSIQRQCKLLSARIFKELQMFSFPYCLWFLPHFEFRYLDANVRQMLHPQIFWTTFFSRTLFWFNTIQSWNRLLMNGVLCFPSCPTPSPDEASCRSLKLEFLNIFRSKQLQKVMLFLLQVMVEHQFAAMSCFSLTKTNYIQKNYYVLENVLIAYLPEGRKISKMMCENAVTSESGWKREYYSMKLLNKHVCRHAIMERGAQPEMVLGESGELWVLASSSFSRWYGEELGKALSLCSLRAKECKSNVRYMKKFASNGLNFGLRVQNRLLILYPCITWHFRALTFLGCRELYLLGYKQNCFFSLVFRLFRNEKLRELNEFLPIVTFPISRFRFRLFCLILQIYCIPSNWRI